MNMRNFENRLKIECFVWIFCIPSFLIKKYDLNGKCKDTIVAFVTRRVAENSLELFHHFLLNFTYES